MIGLKHTHTHTRYQVYHSSICNKLADLKDEPNARNCALQCVCMHLYVLATHSGRVTQRPLVILLQIIAFHLSDMAIL